MRSGSEFIKESEPVEEPTITMDFTLDEVVLLGEAIGMIVLAAPACADTAMSIMHKLKENDSELLDIPHEVKTYTGFGKALARLSNEMWRDDVKEAARADIAEYEASKKTPDPLD